MSRTYKVTVKMLREYSATIAIRAESQDEADQAALKAFDRWAVKEGYQVCPLGFPKPWDEHESFDHEPEIDRRFRCVDCAKDTSNSGEYYSVWDDLWAASGADDGMLCLACLERRTGRLLTAEDFRMWPDAGVWERHLAARTSRADPVPEQLEMLDS